MLLAPALARTRPNVHAFQCLANHERLMAAMAMYTQDNHEFFPPNPDDGAGAVGFEWCCGDVSGGVPNNTISPPAPDMTNPDNLTNPLRCLIASYLGRYPSFFKCPSDPRYGPYNGSDPSLKGAIIPAVRSISMNQGAGTVDPAFADGVGHMGRPTFPVNGPWLDGKHGHAAGHPYATFGRMTDFAMVRPANIFILLDEDPYSINDAAFAVSAAEAELVDYPASYHDNAGSFSFGDGHAELHRWLGTNVNLAGPFPPQAVGSPGSPDYQDWLWLASHATINTKTGKVP
jgi:prepilin-type processing-associated H-X9-DG protein